MDVDALDGEIVAGAGGYVDDDLDLDDDDDDEPLVPGAPRSAAAVSPRLPGASPRLAAASPKLQGASPRLAGAAARLPGAPPKLAAASPRLLGVPPRIPPPLQRAKPPKRRLAPPSPRVPKREKPAAHPNDFLLRASGSGDLRDYVVAKFVTRVPEFADGAAVRLYRNTEATADGRKNGIEANRKQQLYYKSFSGRQRLARYAKQGIVTIPDRYRKGWTMEITDPEKQAQNPPLSSFGGLPVPGAVGSGAGDPTSRDIQPDGDENAAVATDGIDPNADVFAGTFDGKSTSRYAIMILEEGSKMIDVMPIDEYAWFSFRTNRAQGGDTAEELEHRVGKAAKKGQNRMNRFQVKYEEAQGIREQNMGDNTRIKNSKEFAGFGIRRGKAKAEPEEGGGEEMDFDQEFDNDDVAQVDKETVEKTEPRVLGDAEQNAKDFRKMIKDEPISNSRPASPGSESDEEATQRRSPTSASRSPSPSREVGSSRSPNRSTKSTPPTTSRQPTPMGASPATFGVSPSPRSPRGNTSKQDLSHLLPPPGVLPTARHATAVLTVLLKDQNRIPLKEVLHYFERKTKEQKANLQRVLRQVAAVTSDPSNPKNYFVALKSPVPGGLPSGR